eukprot:977893-Prymnesium_polylepis.1
MRRTRLLDQSQGAAARLRRRECTELARRARRQRPRAEQRVAGEADDVAVVLRDHVDQPRE